jgi:DNA-binding LacI/PurR family transcriptional regulator
MTDVARMAGVSHQTVSRVLNGHSSVRASTRQRVEAAIEQLGYRPNLAARALVTGRSATLGLVTLDTTLFGPVATLYGIERAAREAGYYLSVVSLRSIDHDSLGEALQRLIAQAVAGVVIIAPLASAGRALTGLPRGLPLVVVEGDPGTRLAVVTVDQHLGARLATEHLLALGHSTVFHVSGPDEWTEARERVSGWRAALDAARAPVPPVIRGDWTARSGYEAGCRLAAEPDASAVFVANDHMALGVLRAMSERGRKVPEQMSVVGFDDIAESEYFTPPLTTVHQDFDAVGRRSLELLLEQVDGDASGGDAPGGDAPGGDAPGGEARVGIAPQLVVRQSTARR